MPRASGAGNLALSLKGAAGSLRAFAGLGITANCYVAGVASVLFRMINAGFNLALNTVNGIAIFTIVHNISLQKI